MVARDNVNAINMKASLWHRRLSHISEKELNIFAKNDILPGLKIVYLEKDSHCMDGKQTRVSFKIHHPSRNSKLLQRFILLPLLMIVPGNYGFMP